MSSAKNNPFVKKLTESAEPETADFFDETFKEHSKVSFKEISPTHQHRLEAAYWIATHTNLVPCFWGPTSSGKTYSVLELARRLGLEPKILLLSQEVPSEVCGFYTEAKGGRISKELPPWYSVDKKILLFLDELGNAREQTLGAIQHLLREKNLQGVPLASGSLTMAALNPAHLDGAIRERLAFIHFPLLGEYLREIDSKWEVPAGEINIFNDDPRYSNEPPPAKTRNAASAHARTAMSHVSFFSLTPEAQKIVAYACLAEQDAEKLLRQMGSNWSIDQLLDDILKRKPEMITQMLNEVPLPKAIQLTFSLGLASAGRLNPKEKAQLVFRILDSYITNVDRYEALYKAPHPAGFGSALEDLDVKELERLISKGGIIGFISNKVFYATGGRWLEYYVQFLETKDKTEVEKILKENRSLKQKLARTKRESTAKTKSSKVP